jgi:hypothetical protein
MLDKIKLSNSADSNQSPEAENESKNPAEDESKNPKSFKKKAEEFKEKSTWTKSALNAAKNLAKILNLKWLVALLEEGENVTDVAKTTTTVIEKAKDLVKGSEKTPKSEDEKKSDSKKKDSETPESEDEKK